MSSLPREVDFDADREATPARMNRAMDYLIARLRAVEAVQPEFLSALDELKGVGLQRVTDALIPVFDQANAIAESLEAIRDIWEADLLPSQVVASATANVTAAFSDYRNNYLGAKPAAPTVRADGSPVVVGCLYFDTVLDQMRVLGAGGWKNAGSAVAGIMNQFAPVVATAAQTTFTIPGGYDVGYLILTVNGQVIPPTDFVATDGTTVMLAGPLNAGDELAGVAFGAVTLTSVYTKAQVDAGFAAIGAAYTKAAADAKFALIGTSYTKAEAVGQFANLSFSNLTDAAAARANLGVGTAGARSDSYFVRATMLITGAADPGAGAPEGAVWVAG